MSISTEIYATVWWFGITIASSHLLYPHCTWLTLLLLLSLNMNYRKSWYSSFQTLVHFLLYRPFQRICQSLRSLFLYDEELSPSKQKDHPLWAFYFCLLSIQPPYSHNPNTRYNFNSLIVFQKHMYRSSSNGYTNNWK